MSYEYYLISIGNHAIYVKNKYERVLKSFKSRNDGLVHEQTNLWHDIIQFTITNGISDIFMDTNETYSLCTCETCKSFIKKMDITNKSRNLIDMLIVEHPSYEGWLRVSTNVTDPKEKEVVQRITSDFKRSLGKYKTLSYD